MPIFSKGDTRNKLLILYLLDAAPYALTERQLYTVLFETDSISYFDFCEAIAQLQEDAYLTVESTVSGSVYRLTASAAEALALFGESVPLSERERVTVYEQEHREALQNTAQYQSRMQEAADGGYTVQLMAAEGDRILFCLELPAATRELAMRMRNNWSDVCPTLYRQALETLLKD